MWPNRLRQAPDHSGAPRKRPGLCASFKADWPWRKVPRRPSRVEKLPSTVYTNRRRKLRKASANSKARRRGNGKPPGCTQDFKTRRHARCQREKSMNPRGNPPRLHIGPIRTRDTTSRTSRPECAGLRANRPLSHSRSGKPFQNTPRFRVRPPSPRAQPLCY